MINTGMYVPQKETLSHKVIDLEAAYEEQKSIIERVGLWRITLEL